MRYITVAIKDEGVCVSSASHLGGRRGNCCTIAMALDCVHFIIADTPKVDIKLEKNLSAKNGHTTDFGFHISFRAFFAENGSYFDFNIKLQKSQDPFLSPLAGSHTSYP